ncbi:hypothetical protein, partial [Nevskia sp.]|uniref:hypothetical protein n=1 Tax=Nevskia sp. TaxID=1929292 RepID=UPI003458CE63
SQALPPRPRALSRRGFERGLARGDGGYLVRRRRQVFRQDATRTARGAGQLLPSPPGRTTAGSRAHAAFRRPRRNRGAGRCVPVGLNSAWRA